MENQSSGTIVNKKEDGRGALPLYSPAQGTNPYPLKTRFLLWKSRVVYGKLIVGNPCMAEMKCLKHLVCLISTQNGLVFFLIMDTP